MLTYNKKKNLTGYNQTIQLVRPSVTHLRDSLYTHAAYCFRGIRLWGNCTNHIDHNEWKNLFVASSDDDRVKA